MFKKPVLSKKVGWIWIIFLVALDALLDVFFAGGQGNPLWKPIANALGIKMVPLFAPAVLIIFYFFVKIGGWLVEKTDKTPMSYELVLTELVIVYGFFDLWLIAFYFFHFSFVGNYRFLIIPLTAIGLIYVLWAQRKLKIAEVEKE